MANPYHHACSSAQRWGGTPEDYQAIHDWLDASKEFMPDFRHRALRHHAQGIFECERVFGHAIKNSAGRMIPVRWIAEQHVQEDCGRIPTIPDWFKHIRPEHWMGQPPIQLEAVVADIERDPRGTSEDRWHRHIGKRIGSARHPRRVSARTKKTRTTALRSVGKRTR